MTFVHALLEVPSERESLRTMSDSEFLDRLELIYSADVVQRVGWQLETFRESGMEAQALALRERYLARMHNLSAFMAELKQRFYPSFVELGSEAAHSREPLSRPFRVEEVFGANREHFSKRRIDGARKMRHVRWGGLLSLRDLRDRAPAGLRGDRIPGFMPRPQRAARQQRRLR